MTVELELEPTQKEICIMCHWSSSCDGCCKICEKHCNSRQICMTGHDEQYDRLGAWLNIKASEVK